MDIERLIRKYLDENVLFTDGSFQYDDQTSFHAAGILDSVGILELVTWTDATFRVSTGLQEITPENFDSVASLAQYIRSKMGHRDALPAAREEKALAS